MYIFFGIMLTFLSAGVFTLTPGVRKWETDQNCTKVGPSCSLDCQTIALCNTVGKAPTVTFDCKEKICIEENGTGVCKEDAFCATDPELKIICGIKGEIPNPFNCSQSFICSKESEEVKLDEPTECSSGYFWDISSKGCKKGECKRNPIKCNPVYGSIDPSNDRFQYYCNEKEVYVYEQPLDDSLNDEETTTSEPNVSTDEPTTVAEPTEATEEPTTSADSNIPSTATTELTTTTEPTIATDEPTSSTESTIPTTASPVESCNVSTNVARPTCRQANILYEISGKPCCYWKCNTNLVPEPKPCTTGYYFNASRDGCIPLAAGQTCS